MRIIIKTLQTHSVSRATRLLFTMFLIILIPTYLKHYGPQNFLWLSDVGLFTTFFIVWLGSPLLNSICMISIFPIELMWYIDFFVQTITGFNIFGSTDYMFDPQYGLFLRSLSLFHIVVPMMWIWYLLKWGYDKRALTWAIVLIWSVLVATFMCTNPAYNINWVFVPQQHNLTIHPVAWLLFMMVASLALVILPMHYILALLCKKPNQINQ